ncbi:MAG: ABC transporter ATP-binding protein [Desulfovibrio sp.]
MSGIDATPPLLECRELSLGYGKENLVLSGVNLRIQRGELVALLGPNGAGKSTLIAGLCGIAAPQRGEVLLQGEPISRLSPREVAQRCAVVSQRAEPAFGLRVRTLVEMGRYARLPFWGNPDPEDRLAVDAALEATGTSPYRNRPADQLSGGEMQRVFLARALAQETPLLLLDEPFASMDAAWSIRCFDLLQRGAAQSAVLLALHDINLAALYCTRILFIKNNGVAFDGSPKRLFTETALSELYETEIKIGTHPVTGSPQAFPVPGAASCGVLGRGSNSCAADAESSGKR